MEEEKLTLKISLFYFSWIVSEKCRLVTLSKQVLKGRGERDEQTEMPPLPQTNYP